MKINGQVIGVLAVLVGVGSTLGAQEAPATPCRETTCNLSVDWKDIPNVNDRRYGSPYEFERLVLQHLRAAGYSFTVGASGDADVATIRIEPRMKDAACEIISGSESGQNCETIGELRVEIVNVASELDIKGSFRIRGRCGADEMMDVKRISEYAAGMLVYELLKGQDRKKPSSRC